MKEQAQIRLQSEPFTISSNLEKSIYLLQIQESKLHCLHNFENIHSEQISSHKYTELSDFSCIISTSFDKSLKLTQLDKNQKFKIINQIQSFAQKKVTGNVIGEDDIIFYDKFGNILRINLVEAVTTQEKKTIENQNIQANFEEITISKFINVPQSFQVSSEKQKYLLIQDEYFKIKVFNYPKVYKISAIWTPIKQKLYGVFPMNDRLIFAFYGNNECQFWAMEYSNLEQGEWKAIQISFLAKNKFQNEKLQDILIEAINKSQLVVVFIYQTYFICQEYDYKSFNEIKLIKEINASKEDIENKYSILLAQSSYIIIESQTKILTEKYNLNEIKNTQLNDDCVQFDISDEEKIYFLKL